MRLGLFGGSFDPIHLGHLAIARGARGPAALDRCVLMVARVSPLKSETSAPAEDRLALVRAAIAGEAWLEASDLELRRAGPSFTIDTVRELRAIHRGAEIVLLLGSDSLAQLPRWRDVRALLTECEPRVAPRRGVGREAIAALRLELGDEIAARIERGWLDLPFCDVSSTDVRMRLSRGASVEDAVPASVLAEIRARGLYGARRAG